VTPAGPVVVVGEALFDLVPAPGAGGAGELTLRALPGGGPANTAVGLARLGVPTRFAGRLATAGLGPRRRRLLAEEGIDLGLAVDAAEPATVTIVSLDGAGVATYELHGPDTADWQWQPGELPDPGGLRAAAVHTGTLAAILEPGATSLLGWLGELRRREDVVVSYDPNVRLTIVPDVARYRTTVERFVACTHIVKVSADDLADLWPDRSPEAVVAGWLAADPGPSVVTVTWGENDAAVHLRGGPRVSRPTPPVEVVDTVGAGDAFAAGFLAALHAGGRLTPAGIGSLDEPTVGAALEWANDVASRCCARAGADPPRAADLDGWPTGAPAQAGRSR
jgi:fructokinase